MPPPSGRPLSGPVGDPVGEPPPPPWWSQRHAILPVWLWILLGLVAVAGAAPVVMSNGDSRSDAVAVPNDEPAGPQDSVVSSGSAPPASALAAGSPPTIAVAPTTETAATTAITTSTVPPDLAPAAAAATERAPTGTDGGSTTSTMAVAITAPAGEDATSQPDNPTTNPTTTLASVPDVTPAGTPSTAETVAITPRFGPCRYGNDCLIAAFSISGFSPLPKTFTCEFSSGIRYTFRFSGTLVDLACSTADGDDTITIEIAGVRSEPVVASEGLVETAFRRFQR